MTLIITSIYFRNIRSACVMAMQGIFCDVGTWVRKNFRLKSVMTILLAIRLQTRWPVCYTNTRRSQSLRNTKRTQRSVRSRPSPFSVTTEIPRRPERLTVWRNTSAAKWRNDKENGGDRNNSKAFPKVGGEEGKRRNKWFKQKYIQKEK